MPLQSLNIVTARAEIIRLRMEVARLEHALTTSKILAVTLAPPKVVVTPPNLSRRETEVLVRIMAGNSTDEIAHRLYMSPHTVKSHIGRIYHKLHVHNRGGAAATGVHLGLDAPQEEESSCD